MKGNKIKKIAISIIAILIAVFFIYKIAESIKLNRFGHFVKGPELVDDKGYIYFEKTNWHILNNGDVILFGNNANSTNKIHKTEIYNPKTNTLKVSNILLDKDWSYVSISMGENVFIGADSKKNNKTKEVYWLLYDPIHKKVIKQFEGTKGSPQIVLQNRYILFFNKLYKKNSKGFEAFVGYAIHKLDTKSGKFTAIGKIDSKGVDVTSAIALDENRVFMYVYRNAPYIIDISSNKIKKIDKPAVARSHPVFVRLKNSDILILGGSNGSSKFHGANCIRKAEILDNKTLKYRPAGEMTYERCSLFSRGFNAVLLQDGRVFIAGGQNFDKSKFFKERTLKTTEIYNPKTNTFVQSANMNEARMNAQLVPLKNGDVLVYGGTPSRGVYSLKTTEVFKVKR